MLEFIGHRAWIIVCFMLDTHLELGSNIEIHSLFYIHAIV
jgi:hypothetical protein